MSDDGDLNEKQKSFNNEEKKKRRTRKDEEGRTFTCPCGKSYLSYPALYTHTKTKHQGKVPKEDGHGGIIKEPVEEEIEMKDPMNQCRQLINSYFASNDQSEYPTPPPDQVMQSLSTMINNWEVVKQQKLEDPSNNLSESITTVISRYLSEMHPILSKCGYLYLCQLLHSISQHLQQQTKDPTFYDTNNTTAWCHILNGYISGGNSSPLGSPLNNSGLKSRLLQGIAAWMFEQRYTNSLVKFNFS